MNDRGIPGIYRQLTKKIARTVGVLEQDRDIYGHLRVKEIHNLFDAIQWKCLYSKNCGLDYPSTFYTYLRWFGRQLL